jgi:hypothetical protein
MTTVDNIKQIEVVVIADTNNISSLVENIIGTGCTEENFSISTINTQALSEFEDGYFITQI